MGTTGGSIISIPSGTPAAIGWTTPAPVSYTYKGHQYSGYLGNYWDTYTGTDADNNGIGDTTFALISIQADTAPLMNWTQDYFSSSPAAPTAGFSANATVGKTPMTVRFTDESIGTVTSRAWDFGDGAISTEQNPVHTYTTAGNYTVALNVTNNVGSNTLTRPEYISITTRLIPIVSFTANASAGSDPLVVQFTDTSLYVPTNWAWDFGDGTTSTEQNPVHTYSIGTYSINLTATNGDGSNSTTKTDYITVTKNGPLSNYRFINLYVANDEGVKYDVPNGAAGSGGTYTYVPNTYWVMFRQAGGGLNPMHISGKSNTWTAADLTTTTNQSGSFFITFSGGQPSMPNAILLLAVNGTVPDDFRVHIRSSGQDFNVGTPSIGNQVLPAASTFLDGAVNQTFTRSDFLYGPQSWRPSSSAGYPIYNGEDQADPANQFQLMFIDLKVGALQNASLPNNGMIKVEYEFTNLSSVAVFNTYGWYMQCNHGTGIIMTNQVDLSGYMVTPPVKTITPIASFTSNVQTGTAPLTVTFTDTSANTPTSWLWDFGDNSTAITQNVTHTYTTAGTYTVNLTATNGKGMNTITRLGYITVTAPLPDYNNIFVSVANEAGVKYNAFNNNTYYVSFKGANSGFNALHISTDPSVNYGQVTTTGNHDGTFYVTDSGGKGYEDEIILLVAVNGTIPDNFRLNVKADGYNWTPNPVSNTAPSLDNVTYQSVALNETFTKSDFIYGPQIWKPTANGYTYPIYYGQNMSEPGNTFQLMFIDLNAGVLRPNTALMNQGAVRINYSLQNLGSVAVFNVYAYCKNSNNGNDMVAWTNALTSAQSSGYLVTNGYIPAPVANFTANMTSGTMPLTVQFTDASTNAPTSWLWDFGDNSTAITQNVTHTYTTAGTYTVNLTVTNAAGTNSLVRDKYISVRNASADLAQLILPAASLYQNTATQLPVLVTNITRGTGILFNLAYDPAVIRVNEITLNQSYASGSNFVINQTDGLIRLSLTSTDGITIGSPVPVFFLNTTSTGEVSSQTPLTLTSAMWSDTTFNKRQLDTVNGSALVYRIRGD
ncbi:MAG: PKD domain-containing protein, partial [Methanoregula sp.]